MKPMLAIVALSFVRRSGVPRWRLAGYDEVAIGGYVAYARSGRTGRRIPAKRGAACRGRRFDRRDRYVAQEIVQSMPAISVV